MRFHTLLACLPLCLLLCGCEVLPYPRELESTMLVRMLGVDWTEEGVVLTAADIPEEGKESTLLTAEGKTFEESVQKLKQSGEEYVALTHVTQIVVGAESDLVSVLEAALLQREVGQSATVWQAEGSARGLMEQVNGGAKRLTSLELNVAGLKTATVLEALARLEESGEVSLPRLGIKEGTLEVVS